MLKRLKAQLRAWLIGAMRDAIRMEYYAQPRGLSGSGHGAQQANANAPKFGDYAFERAQMATPAHKTVTAPIPDPSFEQMQAEAIQAQEKYYEPAK